MTCDHNPLVSLIVMCYNQRDTIETALDGAFAQTYSPLEIVVIDDGSTDGSKELIIKKIESAVPTLKHEVRFVNNTVNLAQLQTFYLAGCVAKGELCVKADGDDVSLPTRVKCIVDAWRRSGYSATLISHRYYEVDGFQRYIGNGRGVCATDGLGAVMAWSKDCWTKFPAIKRRASVDDEVFAWRAMFLGSEIVLPDYLVIYQANGGISTSFSFEKKRLLKKSLVVVGWQILDDLHVAKQWLPNPIYQEYLHRLCRRYHETVVHFRLLIGKTMATRYRAYKAMNLHGYKARIPFFLYVLPPMLSFSLLRFYNSIRSTYKVIKYNRKPKPWL